MSSENVTIEITDSGYLRLQRETAEIYFPSDNLLALCRNDSLLLLPTRGPAAGGLILKQRNPNGERSVLVSEVFDFCVQAGTYHATWDDRVGGLRVLLRQELLA